MPRNKFGIKAVRRPREPTITLINIVFLMLIFFLIAGTLAPPLDPDLTLVSTDEMQEGREPPDALVIGATGAMTYRGEAMDAATYVALMAEPGSETGGEIGGEIGGRPEITTVRIVPDRDLAAHKLLEIGRALQEAGADRVFLVTQRSLK